MTSPGPAARFGTEPPDTVCLGGDEIRLAPLAGLITELYLEEFPDQLAAHGRQAVTACTYANHWLLAWAAQDAVGAADVVAQSVWMGRVMHARGFPVADLVRDLQIAARVTADGSFGDASAVVSERIASAAHTVASIDFAGGA